MFTNTIEECYKENDTISGTYVINLSLYLSTIVEMFTFSIKVSWADTFSVCGCFAIAIVGVKSLTFFSLVKV